MNTTTCEYAVNKKNPSAIVYPNPCGRSVFLTAEMFHSEQEFAFWKNVSDDDYRARERAERREAAHVIAWAETVTPSFALSAEQELLKKTEAYDRHCRLQNVVLFLRTSLTKTQYQRFLLHVLFGVSETQIAAHEGVSVSAVAKSIRLTKKKLAAAFR